MRNQFNTSFKFTKESSYVGGIQLSKGMLWAKMKREEEAKNTKVVNKIFSNQAPAHSNTKKNQPVTVTTSSSQRPSVKGNDSWASTPRTTYTTKPKASPRDSFRSTKINTFELIEPKESKLMKLSKKIAKFEAPSREPLYKAPVKRLAKGVVKQQPQTRPITTSNFTAAPVIPPVVHVAPKITKKVFKEDVKKNVFVANQPVFREQRSTNMVSKSFDFKSWGNIQHETSYKEPAPSNKYRGAMRARKVPCETLKYKSVISRKEHKFKCFKEKDLGIPKQFCNKIIHHTVDNDCYTDDEQLGLAVKNLYFSLRLATEEIAV